jgi:hypothetical protein
MHDLEPYSRWLYLYDQTEDRLSPFYNRESPESGYHLLYDHLIHPDWDTIGSETLYVKVLYVNNSMGFAVMELMGEWNDVIGNDIMWLKRKLIDRMLARGIQKFILLGENVLNYHGDEDAYYEEWSEDSPQGWVIAMGFRAHITDEWEGMGLSRYMHFGEEWTDAVWRTRHPLQMYWAVSARLNPSLEIPLEIPQLK